MIEIIAPTGGEVIESEHNETDTIINKHKNVYTIFSRCTLFTNDAAWLFLSCLGYYRCCKLMTSLIVYILQVAYMQS